MGNRCGCREGVALRERRPQWRELRAGGDRNIGVNATDLSQLQKVVELNKNPALPDRFPTTCFKFVKVTITFHDPPPFGEQLKSRDSINWRAVQI